MKLYIIERYMRINANAIYSKNGCVSPLQKVVISNPAKRLTFNYNIDYINITIINSFIVIVE